MEEMDVPDGGVMDVQGSSSFSLSNGNDDGDEPQLGMTMLSWSDDRAVVFNKPSWGNRLKKPNTGIMFYKGIEEETLHGSTTTRENDGFGCFLITTPPRQRSSKRQYDSLRRRSTDENYSSTSSITSTTNRLTNFADNRQSYDGTNNINILPDTRFAKGQPANGKKRIKNNDDAEERPFYNTDRLVGDDDGSPEVQTTTRKKSTKKEDHHQLKFPQVLHQLLTALELRGETTIAGFRPHGRAFAIYDPTAFVRDIMPRWFRQQSKFTSFQRQVNLYNFQRITRGADAGSYWHPLFLRGRETLTIAIQRTKTKGTTRPVHDIAPNFWAMPAIDSTGQESSMLLLSLRRSHLNRTLVGNMRAKRDESIAVAGATGQTVLKEASSIVTSPITRRRIKH